ncbi:MAG TPA: sugar porter family MFS transporter [Verrucomicrobiae bacterium]|nr:sugar porter family MFS transporter [Verrucomicrobiae bacterium]
MTPSSVESHPSAAKSCSIRGPMLVLVACVALAGGFLFGYDTAVINGANQFLKAFFQLTPFQEGIAGASAILGCIPGAMFAGYFSDRFGRRKVLFVCAILYALSGVLSAVPKTFTEFLLARFISGLGIGASSMICPVYVAELAPAAWRGRFGSLFQFGIVSGIFLTLFINARIQAFGDAAWNAAQGWRWMLGAEIFPALLLLLLLFFVKESPRWLVQVGREGEARDILEKIHRPPEADAEIAATKDVLKQSEAGFFELLANPRFRRVLVIAVLLMAFSQFSGINAIMYYSTKIFTTAGVGVKDSFMASEVVGLVNLLFTLVAVALVDKAGRRILLLVGLVAQVIALGAVGWMFKANTGGIALLIAILAFIGAFAMALGPIPWILCSEIFPTRVRGRAMSVATFTIWTSCYIVAQTFPMLNDSARVGPALTFWIYAGCSLAALVFVFFMVPETKGRSLEEIEASFAE